MLGFGRSDRPLADARGYQPCESYSPAAPRVSKGILIQPLTIHLTWIGNFLGSSGVYNTKRRLDVLGLQ